MTIWSRSLATMAVRKVVPCGGSGPFATKSGDQTARSGTGEAALASVKWVWPPVRCSRPSRVCHSSARPACSTGTAACSQPGSTPPGITFGDIISR